jgi:hypothetical protein
LPDIEARAKTLQCLTKDLQSSYDTTATSIADKRIRDLRVKCASLAGQLLALVDEAKPTRKSVLDKVKIAG